MYHGILGILFTLRNFVLWIYVKVYDILKGSMVSKVRFQKESPIPWSQGTFHRTFTIDVPKWQYCSFYFVFFFFGSWFCTSMVDYTATRKWWWSSLPWVHYCLHLRLWSLFQLKLNFGGHCCFSVKVNVVLKYYYGVVSQWHRLPLFRKSKNGHRTLDTGAIVWHWVPEWRAYAIFFTYSIYSGNLRGGMQVIIWTAIQLHYGQASVVLWVYLVEWK